MVSAAWELKDCLNVDVMTDMTELIVLFPLKKTAKMEKTMIKVNCEKQKC